jgi:hypothetical protein
MWVAAPFAVGPLLADALSTKSDSIASVASWIAWIVWVCAVLASLIPRAVSLTALRVAGPAAVTAAAWAAVVDGDVIASALALVASGVTAVVGFTAWVADDCVNGASYGDERRFLLRSPGSLLVGPVELAWIVAAAGVTVGPILVAADNLTLGLVATAIGVPMFLVAFRSLHALSIRVAVMVPAGLTIVDGLTLAEPKLFPASSITELGPASVDTGAFDLSQHALGRAIEVSVAEPADLAVLATRDGADREMVDAFLFTPASPAALLAEAARRELPVS